MDLYKYPGTDSIRCWRLSSSSDFCVGWYHPRYFITSLLAQQSWSSTAYSFSWHWLPVRLQPATLRVLLPVSSFEMMKNNSFFSKGCSRSQIVAEPLASHPTWTRGQEQDTDLWNHHYQHQVRTVFCRDAPQVSLRSGMGRRFGQGTGRNDIRQVFLCTRFSLQGKRYRIHTQRHHSDRFLGSNRWTWWNWVGQRQDLFGGLCVNLIWLFNLIRFMQTIPFTRGTISFSLAGLLQDQ